MRRPRVSALAFGSLILLITFAATVVIIASAPGRAASVASTAVTLPRIGGAAAATPAPAGARGYLGVQVVPVDAAARQRYNLSRDSGAVIVSVEPDSAAEQAGLTVGDLIAGVDGKPVNRVQDLTADLAGHHPGDRISLRVFSGQRQHTVQVTLGAALPSAAAALPPAIADLPPALLGPVLGALGGGSLSHFTSAEVTTTDASGRTVTTRVLGGVVKVASSKRVTVTPNGGGADQQFMVGPATIVNAGPGRANALDLTAGMHVLVVTQNNSPQALEIIAVDHPGGLLPALPSLPLPRPTATPVRSVQ